ncbi:MAG: DUF2179 domain-containing protein [Spirochaetota bacterium]|nr:DUF2179 domain-containing protein [Spirochaetota bacterium]
MNITSIISFDIFSYVILPLLIFIARVCDVSIGTIRIIFVSKGNKVLSPLLGFFEILIWLCAIGQIMQNLNNFGCFIAYAGGFAAGNFVGIFIEERLAVGILLIRIITKRDASQLIEYLKADGYGVTVIDAEGACGKVNVIYTIIDRHNLEDVVGIIKSFNPKAFYSVEDVKFISERISPLKNSRTPKNNKLLQLLRLRKKEK